MPQPIKQTPPRPPAPPPPRGDDVLASAVPASTLDDAWMKVMIYGRNGVGKTYLACEFPKPLLLISFEPNTEGGAKTVRKRPGVMYLRITEVAQLVMLAEQLKRNNVADFTDRNPRSPHYGKVDPIHAAYHRQPYQTHVLDTVTSLQNEVIMPNVTGTDVPSVIRYQSYDRSVYMARSEMTRDLVKPFGNMPCNTVYICQEKDHNRDKEQPAILGGFQLQSFISADLGEATARWLTDRADYCVRLYIDEEMKRPEYKQKIKGKDGVIREEVRYKPTPVPTGRHIRFLRTAYHPNYAARMRSEGGDESIPDFMELPSYEKLLAVARGTWKKPAE